MKLDRRSAQAGAAPFSVAPRLSAQDFPSRPIEMVVPLAAGSTTDIAARGLGAKLQEEILRRPIIVDDKPGASGQPQPLQQKLYDAITEALKDPVVGKAMTQGRMEVPPLGLGDLAACVKTETAWWTEHVNAAGIEPE